MRNPLLLFALALVPACGASNDAPRAQDIPANDAAGSGGTFPITIDATALTQSSLVIAAPFDTRRVQAVALAPGMYTLGVVEGQPSDVTFTVTARGLVDYDVALDGILAGRATSALMIVGRHLTVDARALTQTRLAPHIAGSGDLTFDTRALADLVLIPSHGYRLSVGDGRLSDLAFDLDTYGKVHLASQYAASARGEGTSTLTLVGFRIGIAAPIAGTAFQLDGLYGDAVSLSTLQTSFVTLLPLSSATPAYALDLAAGARSTLRFNVDESGHVTYGATFDGYVQGRGAALLTVRPMAVTVDATERGAGSFAVGALTGAGPFDRAAKPVLGLIPTEAGYTYSDAALSFPFNVTEAGALDFATTLDAQVTGRGTRVLAVHAAATAPQLVGEWAFDEGAGQVVHDRSGRAHDGTLGLSTAAEAIDPTWATDRAALAFSGAQRASVPRAADLEPAFVSIEAWVKGTGAQPTNHYLVAKQQAGCTLGQYALSTGTSTGGLGFYVNGGGALQNSPEVTPDRIWDGKWHHAAGTYDGHTVTLYVDGVQAGAATVTGAGGAIAYGPATTDGLYFGDSGTCNLPFKGEIADVRVFSGALGAAQVALDASPPAQQDAGVDAAPGACGDGVVNPPAEQCDDGASPPARGLCTASCQAQEQLVSLDAADAGAAALRTLGAGRHPIATDLASAAGASAVVYVDERAEQAQVFGVTFDAHDVEGVPVALAPSSVALAGASPVVAALPGSFAAAFSAPSSSGDESDVTLRRFVAGGVLGGAVTANATTLGAQLDADAVWTGSDLVVAWTDTSATATSPDVRMRRFDASLAPRTGADEDLGVTADGEGDVALAAFAGTWVAAWRARAAVGEMIRAHTPGASWTVGPFLAAPDATRPALVPIDGTRVLLVYLEGRADADGGVASAPVVRGAVLDVASTTAVAPFDVKDTTGATIRALDVNAARAGNAIALGWRSAATPGDPLGEDVWGAYWLGVAAPADVARPLAPFAVPLSAPHRKGDQRALAIAPASTAPPRFFAGWDDRAMTFGAPERAADVAVLRLPPAL